MDEIERYIKRMGVDYDTFDEVKAMAKRQNAGLRDSSIHHEVP